MQRLDGPTSAGLLSGWLRSSRRDLLVIAALLAVAGGAWTFVKLADAVVEGETQHLDESILSALRRADDPTRPIGPRWLTPAMLDLTALGGGTVLGLASLAVLGGLLVARKYHAMLLVAAAIGGGTLLNPLLKGWFIRPRPSVVPHLVEVSSSSFPSGHSMNSAIVYLTLGSLLARLLPSLSMRLYVLAVSIALSLLVGVSRVYLGVHYPTDVLGGWAAGLAWALLVWLAARWLQRRGMVEIPAANAATATTETATCPD